MNRHIQYRPLLERTQENYQCQHLARRYDFGLESRVAQLLIRTINGAMAEAEAVLGIQRIPPWSLFLKTRGGPAALPLLRPDYLEPLLAGEDFGAARQLVRAACREALRTVWPQASEEHLLARIEPWTLARRRGPRRYQDCLEETIDPHRTSRLCREWIEGLKPCDPLKRLTNLDLSAPKSVVEQLTDVVVTEAGLGPIVSRQLIEEIITLRSVCRPRPKQLQSGEMLVLATHVQAHPGLQAAARFRRLAPVIISVWTPEELHAGPVPDVPGQLEQLKTRIVRVCFEAYRQNGLLSTMDLQWIFQISSGRISELLRSVQREHNIVVPTPGTILDAGRSMTHKDIIVGLHWQGYSVMEIARMTFHSPKAVDNYIGTFEAVLIMKLYGMPAPMMARLLRRGLFLIEEHLKLVEKLDIDEHNMRHYLQRKGVNF